MPSAKCRHSVQASVYWVGRVELQLCYRWVSKISCTKSQNLNVSRLILQLLRNLSKSLFYWVQNEDIVGAALSGDAPTTSEW